MLLFHLYAHRSNNKVTWKVLLINSPNFIKEEENLSISSFCNGEGGICGDFLCYS